MTLGNGEQFAASLQRFPRAERREVLQSIVVCEIKSALLMSDQDDVPVDANYFDLGMSSLRVINVKERLQGQLGVGIDTSMFFNQPTVRQVVDYLVSQPLSEHFALVDAQSAAEPDSSSEHYAAKLLDELYSS